jgi:hypothetical protein
MSNFENEFYRCSDEYVDKIDPSIRSDIEAIIEKLPKRKYQNDINSDFVWLFGKRGWSFSSFPNSFPFDPPSDLNIDELDKTSLSKLKIKEECLITSNLKLGWYADFGKSFGSKRVLIEVQFGKIEAAFRDFCRFAITYHERRLDLGILIVMHDPKTYFSEEGSRVSGMAEFETIRKAMWAVDLDCPIWLIGLKEPPQTVQHSLVK